MKPMTLMSAACFVLQLVGCAQSPRPETAQGPPMVVHAELQYKTIDGVAPKSLSLDVYAPKSAKDLPIVLYVHGGGWALGDKKAVGNKPQWFTSKGFVFVSVNYRLVPEGTHPNNVRDLADAIQWVRTNAGNYGGNPKALFLMGHSAGAHLVSLVATHPAYLKQAGAALSDVKGVVSLDTQAYDVPKIVANSPVKLYERAFGDDLKGQEDASPIHQAKKGNGIPPFLICYSRGMGMRRMPERGDAANAFADALKTAGVPAEVVDASDRNHREINQRFGTSKDSVTQRAMAFFARCMAPAQTP